MGNETDSEGAAALMPPSSAREDVLIHCSVELSVLGH